jgi:voltage-gated potassium channel
LLRVVSSFNRGMRALGASMGRRGLGYVVGLSAIVLVAGAAAMYAFENNNPNGNGLNSYPTALYWTAMLMTTIGSEFWPQTPAGRALCLAISIFSIGVFGYLTAALATFFVGRDAEDDGAEVAGTKQINELKKEIAALRDEVRALSRLISKKPASKQEQF